MLANRFSEMFRQEHRKIRDALFTLDKAFQDLDRDRISATIEEIAELTGPHFRYEEEALYPALAEIFGEAYIEKLLSDHDRAIGTAEALSKLAAKEDLNWHDSQRATDFVRSILPHVSDCEGLSIMVETFPDEQVQRILETREACAREGLDLIQWATRVRRRPYEKVQADLIAADSPRADWFMPGA